MLGIKQIEDIFNQVSKNILLYVGVSLGEEVFSEADLKLLRSMGVKVENIGGDFPPYYRMYLLGRLTKLLGDYNSQRISYQDFEEYLRRKQFQPLTEFEKVQYRIAQHATYTHLKNLENRIRTDVNNTIISHLSRVEYEEIIKKEIERGVVERKLLGSIISDIGHKTGDWRKDLGRIVHTEMNNIFQQGRAVQIARENPGEDPLVYKDVFSGACRHCIELYLTNGLGSEPRVFRLSELIANGSNVGRAVKDWKAVIGSTHPWCRCHLHYLEKWKRWDKEKKQYVYDEILLAEKEKELKIKGKVKVTVGDKVFIV